jgi:hypothetical protein
MSLYFIKDLIMSLEEKQTPAISQKEISEVLHYYARFRTPFPEEQFLREAWKTDSLANRSAIVKAFQHTFERRAQDSSFLPMGWLFPLFFKEAFPSLKMAETKEEDLKPGYYWVICQKDHSPGAKPRCLCFHKAEIAQYRTDVGDKHGLWSGCWQIVGSYEFYEESKYKALAAIPERQ